MKISVVFGTRPEAIKLAPVILALQRQPGLQCRICVTGQHRQMLDQIMDAFGLSPDVDLDLMCPDQTLAGLTARAMSALDEEFARERPDLVLVQGDTTTVFCATLAAFYRHIPVGHVEAGLRTWNLLSPWPEEANRVLTTRLASLHFAPTESARQNLLREEVASELITVTGNTVIDALGYAVERVRANPPAIPGLPKDLQISAKEGSGPRVVLITGHRRENFGAGFEGICESIAELARAFPDVHFVYPVHLNPNVREPVERILSGSAPRERDGLRARAKNIHLLEPLSYLPFVALMRRATLILTDSGGVQEEASSLGKPILVMRDTTERVESVAAGIATLVGTDPRVIVPEVSRLLAAQEGGGEHCRPTGSYGDGRAAEKIVAVCRDFLAGKLGTARTPSHMQSPRESGTEVDPRDALARRQTPGNEPGGDLAFPPGAAAHD